MQIKIAAKIFFGIYPSNGSGGFVGNWQLHQY